MGNPVEASAPPPPAQTFSQPNYNAPPPAYGAAPAFGAPQPDYPKVPQQTAPGGYTSGAVTIAAQPNQTVIVQQPRVNHFTQNQQRMTCMFCNADIVTETRPDCGTGSWVIALALCFFLTPCCMCWPACCDGCKDTVHSCPACKKDLGRRNLM